MKQVLLSVSFWIAVLPSAAQGSIDSLFIKAPSDILPLLSESARMDMLDLFNYGSEATVSNTMGGSSTLIAKSDNQVELHLSKVSTLSMRILPPSEFLNTTDSLICVIHTLTSPSAQSNILFYGLDWQHFEIKKLFNEKDFFIVNDESETHELLDILCPLHIQAEWLSAQHPTLRLSISTNSLSIENAKRIAPKLKTLDIIF